ASVIGLGATLDYLSGLDQDAVSAHEAGEQGGDCQNHHQVESKFTR
ncbi:hypothetical protein HUT00_35335, partial [Pseudomonas chlororaphis]|nr:hypothetical protein [Pseudomonas chlororaphis]